MQENYMQDTVAGAWAHHFAAFGAQDVDKIMQDYTENSVLKAFDHTTGTLVTAKGLNQIAQFFSDLFATLYDVSTLGAPVINVTESTSVTDGSVYLIWSCPSSGITSATDTFIHSPTTRKIVRQNIAFASNPAFTPTYLPQNVAAAWQNHFDAFGAQNLDKIMLDYTPVGTFTMLLLCMCQRYVGCGGQALIHTRVCIFVTTGFCSPVIRTF